MGSSIDGSIIDSSSHPPPSSCWAGVSERLSYPSDPTQPSDSEWVRLQLGERRALESDWVWASQPLTSWPDGWQAHAAAGWTATNSSFIRFSFLNLSALRSEVGQGLSQTLKAQLSCLELSWGLTVQASKLPQKVFRTDNYPSNKTDDERTNALINVTSCACLVSSTQLLQISWDWWKAACLSCEDSLIYNI